MCQIHNYAVDPYLNLDMWVPNGLQFYFDFKNGYVGDGEMTQWVKCLLCKAEDLSLDPISLLLLQHLKCAKENTTTQHPPKRPGTVIGTCFFQRQRAEKKDGS